MKCDVSALIKVSFGNGVRLGEGKVALLKHIAETGSISAAARAMDMSYRKAWMLIKDMNEMFAAPVIETAAGGSGGGGAKVTPHGLKLISAFDELQKEADQLVQKTLAKFY